MYKFHEEKNQQAPSFTKQKPTRSKFHNNKSAQNESYGQFQIHEEEIHCDSFKKRKINNTQQVSRTKINIQQVRWTKINLQQVS